MAQHGEYMTMHCLLWSTLLGWQGDSSSENEAWGMRQPPGLQRSLAAHRTCRCAALASCCDCVRLTLVTSSLSAIAPTRAPQTNACFCLVIAWRWLRCVLITGGLVLGRSSDEDGSSSDDSARRAFLPMAMLTSYEQQQRHTNAPAG